MSVLVQPVMSSECLALTVGIRMSQNLFLFFLTCVFWQSDCTNLDADL